MKFNRPLMLVTLGIALSVAFGLAKSGQAAPPIVMGYYPTYNSFADPSTIRFDRFTHIVVSFIRADPNGKAVPDDKVLDPALINAAHAKGVKVILALGGGGNGKGFTAMVRDPQKSAQFISDVAKILVDSNADGLALDWELPTIDDKAITTAFVSQLRAATKAAKPDSTLILVVNSKPNNSKGYDGPSLRDQVDYLQIMTYDFHGPWSHAGHHTALFENKWDTIDGRVLSFPAVLSYWSGVQGFPASKILFGIAGYGRGFKVQNWGEKPTNPSQYPEISYRDAQALIGKGWTRQWDDEAHAPWLLSDDKTDRISYDDEQSVADKARWLKANGIPGFFIWEMTQEVVNGDNVLTAAAEKAWNDAP